MGKASQYRILTNGEKFRIQVWCRGLFWETISAYYDELEYKDVPRVWDSLDDAKKWIDKNLKNEKLKQTPWEVISQ